MAEHTPGPWEQHGSLIWAPDAHANVGAAGEPRPESSLVEYVPVRMGSPDSDEAYANARLMAAAPDMLAAMEGLVACLGSPRPSQNFGDALGRVHAAIAKARGTRNGSSTRTEGE